jgi:peptidylprolyl isomerase
VGTAKRERQKANRQLRLQELAQQARREKTRRVGLRIGLVVAAVVALVGIAVWLGGDDSDETASSTTTTTTVAGSDYEKPEVTPPAELPTELVVTELIEGEGDISVVGDTVQVHYVGVLSADGTEFDNSYDRGSPLEVTIGSGMVIQGWEQGLIGLQAGGRYQLDIPADLAYGDTGSGSVIKPGDAITFVVDIVSITPGG